MIVLLEGPVRVGDRQLAAAVLAGGVRARPELGATLHDDAAIHDALDAARPAGDSTTALVFADATTSWGRIVRAVEVLKVHGYSRWEFGAPRRTTLPTLSGMQAVPSNAPPADWLVVAVQPEGLEVRVEPWPLGRRSAANKQDPFVIKIPKVNGAYDFAALAHEVARLRAVPSAVPMPIAIVRPDSDIDFGTVLHAIDALHDGRGAPLFREIGLGIRPAWAR